MTILVWLLVSTSSISSPNVLESFSTKQACHVAMEPLLPGGFHYYCVPAYIAIDKAQAKE